MRIKLDENLVAQLVTVLTELGHDVGTVPSEGIAGIDDAVVWQAAHRHQDPLGQWHELGHSPFCSAGF
jgi:predicted nuclease of predicted toxin-antitoxin system